MQMNAARLPSRSAIGRYELDGKVGEGASGVVYRAYDPMLDRDVAIKIARTNTLSDDQVALIVREFKHEARVAGKFAHENVVTVYDVVCDGRLNYLVMEYVPGRSLNDYVKATGPLDVEEALLITHQCCIGLAYIHYHGVIHRDIKPGNILYHPAHRVVKLMDFSVAHKIEEAPPRDTGTIAYMAPEHFDTTRRISTLTDIFALGSTLYRLLTGRYPFGSEHTAFQILHEEPPTVTALRPDLPAPVARLVERAMAKDDGMRYPTAAALARDVERIARALYPQSEVIDATAQYLLD